MDYEVIGAAVAVVGALLWNSPGHAARHCGVVPHVLTGQMISAVNTRIDNILLADRKA